MKLEWMILANHAEEQAGLLYMAGGTWDTVTVNGALEAGPPDAVAVFRGTLVVRVLFHPTETEREHAFQLMVRDEDGHTIHELPELPARIERNKDLPAGWEQGFNLLFELTGMPLPHFGMYTLSILIDGQHLGDRPFRVLQNY